MIHKFNAWAIQYKKDRNSYGHLLNTDNEPIFQSENKSVYIHESRKYARIHKIIVNINTPYRQTKIVPIKVTVEVSDEK
jgi:hypothetical protein